MASAPARIGIQAGLLPDPVPRRTFGTAAQVGFQADPVPRRTYVATAQFDPDYDDVVYTTPSRIRPADPLQTNPGYIVLAAVAILMAIGLLYVFTRGSSRS